MVDPYDVEALADAMHRVLADRELQDDLRRRGLERAAGFTWERTARETVAVYQEVLSQPSGGGPRHG
jgi:alpha-1,3-rhamnosyl/mannosyltransferase